MKNLVLIFTVFSSFIFAQQKKDLSLSFKDSIAVRNVNSILDYSKKTFSSFNSDLKSSSEVNKNLDQLLINTINFNTVIMLGRKVLSLQVYKSK